MVVVTVCVGVDVLIAWILSSVILSLPAPTYVKERLPLTDKGVAKVRVTVVGVPAVVVRPSRDRKVPLYVTVAPFEPAAVARVDMAPAVPTAVLFAAVVNVA